MEGPIDLRDLSIYIYFFKNGHFPKGMYQNLAGGGDRAKQYNLQLLLQTAEGMYLLLWICKGPFIDYVDKQGRGGGGSQMSTKLNELML